MEGMVNRNQISWRCLHIKLKTHTFRTTTLQTDGSAGFRVPVFFGTHRCKHTTELSREHTETSSLKKTNRRRCWPGHRRPKGDTISASSSNPSFRLERCVFSHTELEWESWSRKKSSTTFLSHSTPGECLPMSASVVIFSSALLPAAAVAVDDITPHDHVADSANGRAQCGAQCPYFWLAFRLLNRHLWTVCAKPFECMCKCHTPTSL